MLRNLNLLKILILLISLSVNYAFINAANLEKYNVAFEQKDFKSAFAILQELKLKDKNNAALFYESAKTSMGMKNYQKAVEESAQAVIMSPKTSDYHRLFADTQVLKFVGTQNTSILKLPGFARRVKRSYQTAVNLDPNNIKAREGLALFYMMAPGIIGGSFKKAELQAAAIEKIDKNSAYSLKVGILKQRKRYSQALELIKEWQSIDANDFAPTEAKFRVYLEQEDYKTASKILTEWLEKNPKEMNANYLLGLTAALSSSWT